MALSIKWVLGGKDFYASLRIVDLLGLEETIKGYTVQPPAMIRDSN